LSYVTEIYDEKVLGAGGFCSVTEVHNIQLKQPNPNSSHMITSGLPQNIFERRRSIAERCEDRGRRRYALKRIDRKLIMKKDATFVTGVIDLVMESKYLSAIQHKNIIDIHGASSSHPCSDSFFIILEKMHCTLNERMRFWKRNNRLNSSLDMGDHDEGLLKRLKVAGDICSAVTYLHSRGIIYRDLKPENLGFDINDDVKLFDFGLARVLVGKDCTQNKYLDTFLLTGATGSPRYMAPEVALKKPYNLTADIYSLGVLIWSIYTLKVPYANHSRVSLHERVYSGKERPDIRDMPKRLRSFFSRSWSQDFHERPCCETLLMILNDEIIDISRSSQANPGHIIPEMNKLIEIVH
jgi:serine/threonine protein kinase